MTDTSISGMRLLDPEYDSRQSHGRDLAPVSTDPDALSVTTLEAWVHEIRTQPSWRLESDKCADYYDGNQLTPERAQKLEEMGLGPLVTDLIKPTVNAVLGMEAKTRTDWTVGADDEQYTDVADALKSKIHEAGRESRADRACSDAYAGQIKAGFAAVEVSRDSNPFNYPYRVKAVHRRELFWDWRSVEPDWSDARWLIRERRFDPDHLAAFFPEFADLIRKAGTGWTSLQQEMLAGGGLSPTLMHSLTEERRAGWDESEWRDTERKRVSCREVWYRHWVRGLVLRLPGGRVVEFNQHRPEHIAVVAAGVVQPKVATFDRIRCAFFVGPHRIRDIATGRRRFPYIPFWGYREDLTGVPYGLIRSMISPQDEINARAAKMMWLLNSRQVQIDSDAVDVKYNTLSDASRELGRADGFVVTNPARVNGANAVRIDRNIELSAQQLTLMENAKNAIQQTAGVYPAMMGQNSSASSGLAISSLVEQGMTTLAEINDNYRFARRAVGEALLELLKEDLVAEEEVQIDTGTTKKRVQINVSRFDPATGRSYRFNDVQTSPVKVALSDVPSTPTFRAAQFAQMTEVAKSLSPQAQALVVPFLIEASEMPHRKELAAMLRKQLGIASDPDSPEAQAAQQAQDQMQQQQLEMAARDVLSKIAEREAKTQKILAEAAKLARDQGDEGSAATIERMQLLLTSKAEELQTRRDIAVLQDAGATERTRMQIEAKTGGDHVARVSQAIDELNEADEAAAMAGAPPV